LLGYHRSWYYRWKPVVERQGLEMLRPRERRLPRMPNQLPPWVEERVISFASAIQAWARGAWPRSCGCQCGPCHRTSTS